MSDQRTSPPPKSVDQHLHELLARYGALAPLSDRLREAADQLIRAVRSGGKILTLGNGGSAADAEHIVGELAKSFGPRRRPIEEALRAKIADIYPDAQGKELLERLEGAIPAISLAGCNAYLTAFANDVDYRFAAAQYLYAIGRSGDVLLAISTSGRSANVLHAARLARVLGIHIIALTGQDGGLLKPLANVALCAPARAVHQVQEFHLPIYHFLCMALEDSLFPIAHV